MEAPVQPDPFLRAENPRKILLPLCYFAPVFHFLYIRDHKDVLVDASENFSWQTFRSRCLIAGPNGVQQLSVPVKHAGGKKIPYKEVRISYDEPWVRVHTRALETAYGKAPYFPYFREELFDILLKRHDLLFDLNLGLMNALLRQAGLERELTFTEKYIDDAHGLIDLRLKHEPLMIRYPQVFEDRHGFIPDLSILDYLFNAGPFPNI